MATAQIQRTPTSILEALGFEHVKTRTVEDFPLDNIQIPRYQRDEVRSLINTIARKWNPFKVGVLHVSERQDGSLNMMDGQQRRKGALTTGINVLETKIYKNLTYEQECELYDGLNYNRPLKAMDSFRNKVEQQDSMYVDIYHYLSQIGFNIPALKDDKENKLSILCPKTLIGIYRDRSCPVFKATMRAIAKAYLRQDVLTDESCKNYEFIDGLSLYIHGIKDFNAQHERKLVARLKSDATSAGLICSQAHIINSANGSHFNKALPYNICKIVEEIMKGKQVEQIR
jgi:hypothetical protein